ncbi:diguanylate cyclase [Xanthomonas sp. XNM01]|uniref:diguanylate cyclase n=1 Tax=Xanthomonas sp. XNM01 TaxID=2769289 RepID=UPI001782CAF1|nr:diguanylate cyclase [Xanthomonas sp. XNM01]MBD9370838.1 diguanylate cyclase [Xanthomonas sp. XNM01]
MPPSLLLRSVASLVLAVGVAAPVVAQVAPSPRPHQAQVGRCMASAELNPNEALRLADELLALPDLDDRAEIIVRSCRALALRAAGRGDDAIAAVDQLLALADAPGIPEPLRMDAHLNAGSVLMSTTQQARALALLESVLADSRRRGEAQTTIHALSGIGLARASQLDDAAGALPYFEQAVAMVVQLPHGPPMREATIRYNLAYNLLKLDDYARADAEFQRIETLLAPVAGPGEAGLLARVRSHRGEVLRRQGDLAQARHQFDQALDAQKTVGDIHGQTVTLMGLARLALDENAPERAQGEAEQALALAERGRFVVETRDALELLVAVHAARGDSAGAAGYSARIQTMERERDRVAALDKLARMQAEVEQDLGPGGANAQDVRTAQVMRNGSIALAVLTLLVGGAVLLRMRRRQRQLRVSSSTDALTGLINRGEADSRIKAMLQAHPGDADRRCVLLMIDIDAFKAINDRHGHAVGDEALRHVAGVLREASDRNDLVARWGGEEFLVARADSSREAAFALAEHLRASVERRPLGLPGGATLGISVSIGVAPAPFFPGSEHRDGWQGDLRLADRALYVAKHAGRNAWAGIWGLAEGRGVDLYSVRQNPESALAQGWVVIGGNRPMSWAPVRDEPAPGAARRPSAVPGDGRSSKHGGDPR